MISNLGWEAWCDKCHLPFENTFASRWTTEHELVSALRKAGWVLGKRLICDDCQLITEADLT